METAPSISFQSQRYKRRLLKDKLSRWLIKVGGVSVIVVIALMFLYFISITAPLFKSASATKLHDFTLQGENQTDSLLLSVDEQLQMGMRLSKAGEVTFFSLKNGEIKTRHQLSETADHVSAFSWLPGQEDAFIVGFNNGNIHIAQPKYSINYKDGVGTVAASLTTPYPSDILASAYTTTAIGLVAASNTDNGLLLATFADNSLVLNRFIKAESLWDDADSYDTESTVIATNIKQPSQLLIDGDQRWLYIADKQGNIELFNIANNEPPKLIDQQNLLLGHNQNNSTAVSVNTTKEKHENKPNEMPPDNRLVNLSFLTGSLSILATDAKGNVSQWTPVRDHGNNYQLKRVRTLESKGASVAHIFPEKMTKGFASINDDNSLHLFHTTSERHLLNQPLNQSLSQKTITNGAIAPRSNALLVEYDNHHMELWQLHNEHPEISFKALWQKVWYENHDRPKFLWQSSSAANDFEPKFSLMPLTFGTIKAAFYAMLVATPLALMGAIYTAYFMSKSLQNIVKPAIEIMEAIPTVILGFLAGLWLAPFAEKHLMGILAILLLLPPGILCFAYAWDRSPRKLKEKIPGDWQPLLLIPVIILIATVCIQLDSPVEQLIFGTEFRHWLSDQGVDFDQRNALIVGIAMGFAIIPTIYSITEDAVHCVPSSLINGSLAMGATHWQTMMNIIIPTASPAIFSAVMIGFGRAIGETMIVLMATGNTPIMDVNIFEGMRTLSANLAVELPESEVGSTHFRILFLSALILFAFTFLLNTVAETVRESLRNRFSKV